MVWRVWSRPWIWGGGRGERERPLLLGLGGRMVLEVLHKMTVVSRVVHGGE